jgi:hypothetical protein
MLSVPDTCVNDSGLIVNPAARSDATEDAATVV